MPLDLKEGNSKDAIQHNIGVFYRDFRRKYPEKSSKEIRKMAIAASYQRAEHASAR